MLHVCCSCMINVWSCRWRERGLPFWSGSRQVNENGPYSKFRTGKFDFWLWICHYSCFWRVVLHAASRSLAIFRTADCQICSLQHITVSVIQHSWCNELNLIQTSNPGLFIWHNNRNLKTAVKMQNNYIHFWLYNWSYVKRSY